MPHAYVVIFMMTVITAILANIIPAGTFDRVEDVKMFRSWLPYSLLCRIHGHQYLVCMALCT